MGMMIADDIFGNRMRLVGVLSRSGDVLDSSFEHSYCTSYH